MWNLLRRVGYLLTLRPHKAYSLPITEKDLDNMCQVTVNIFPMSDRKQIQKDLNTVFGKDGCRFVKSMAIFGSTSRVVSETKNPIKRINNFVKYIKDNNEPNCCSFHKAHYVHGYVIGTGYIDDKEVMLKTMRVSYEFNSLPVWSFDQYLRGVIKMYTKSKTCVSCDKSIYLLTKNHACPFCDYVLDNTFNDLTVMPEELTASQIIKTCKWIEKSKGVKIIPDTGIFEYGYFNDSDEG